MGCHWIVGLWDLCEIGTPCCRSDVAAWMPIIAPHWCPGIRVIALVAVEEAGLQESAFVTRTVTARYTLIDGAWFQWVCVFGPAYGSQCPDAWLRWCTKLAKGPSTTHPLATHQCLKINGALTSWLHCARKIAQLQCAFTYANCTYFPRRWTKY